jgi:hypothetical protein
MVGADAMNASQTKHVWVIFFVGFDETGQTAEQQVEPYVGRERVATSADVEDIQADAECAALMRGGRVVAVVADDEAHAERTRAAIEMEIMRYR